MRYVLYFISVLFAFSCSKTYTAQEIVEKAYEAHGGKAAWDAVKTLSYEKESKVYAEDGSVIVNTLQQHDYEMIPSFAGTINWSVDENAYKIMFGAGNAVKFVNDNSTDDILENERAMESVYTALYTVTQPFKLSDPGVMLYYDGTEVLEEGQKVHTVRAEYSTENDNHTKSDTWWYYFDVESFLCIATMVRHGETRSYIKNLAYDKSTPFVFNAHRKGYAVDSERNILFEQSEYFYRNYEVN